MKTEQRRCRLWNWFFHGNFVYHSTQNLLKYDILVSDIQNVFTDEFYFHCWEPPFGWRDTLGTTLHRNKHNRIKIWWISHEQNCPPKESGKTSLQWYILVTPLVNFSWSTVVSSYSWPANSSRWHCGLIPVSSMNKGGWQKTGKYVAQNSLAPAETQTRISTWLLGSPPTAEGDLEPALPPSL